MRAEVIKPQAALEQLSIEEFFARNLRDQWHTPFPHNHSFINRDFINLLIRERDYEPRVGVPLPISWIKYTGPWNKQEADLPTCQPWAYVNSLRVLGLQPHIPFVADLMADASGERPGKGPGMRLEDLRHAVTNHQQSEVVLKLPLNGQNSGQRVDFAELIRSSAMTVKQEIDTGGILLVGVNWEDFSGRDNSGSVCEGHALSIAGYNVRSDNFMDVQIIDSALGIYWTSLEHITKTLMPAEYSFMNRIRKS